MKHSLGSLAAVAALAATTSTEAVVIVSNFSNVDISSGVTEVDIDGNGQVDFEINSSFAEIASFTGGEIVVDGTFISMAPLTEGSLINSGANYNSAANFNSFTGDINGSIAFAGFLFQRDAQTHYAWLEFSFADETFSSGTLIGGAWESQANTAISAGAIPEPSQFALVGGAFALSLIGLRRRRG